MPLLRPLSEDEADWRFRLFRAWYTMSGRMRPLTTLPPGARRTLYWSMPEEPVRSLCLYRRCFESVYSDGLFVRCFSCARVKRDSHIAPLWGIAYAALDVLPGASLQSGELGGLYDVLGAHSFARLRSCYTALVLRRARVRITDLPDCACGHRAALHTGHACRHRPCACPWYKPMRGASP